MPATHTLSSFFLVLTILATSAAHGQEDVIAGSARYPKVSELSWINYQFLDKQRETISNLSQIHYGKRIRSDKGDLNILQRIVDDNLIERDDTRALQALGVVLGDIYLREHKDLLWRVYEDELGKSFAVCVDSTEHCLFPLTMLSRRIEVGAKPDVQLVYDKGWKAIKKQLPRLPFQGE